MSWQNLRTIFSKVCNTGTTFGTKRKKHRRNDQMAEFSIMQSKRPRRTLSSTPHNSSDETHSDDTVCCDPDYDNYCNGCLNKSSKEVLPICTRSKGVTSRVRSPLHEMNNVNRSNKNSTNYTESGRKSDKTNWKQLEQTLHANLPEKRLLEESIATSDSDGNENNVTQTDSFLIQTTQSSGNSQQSCNAKDLASRSPIKNGELARNFSPSREAIWSTGRFPKKVSCRRGGHVEKWRKIINRCKSDYSFWYHANRFRLGIGGSRGRVKAITNSYGRKLVRIEDTRGNEFSIFSSDDDKVNVGGDISFELSGNPYNVNNERCYLGFNKILKDRTVE